MKKTYILNFLVVSVLILISTVQSFGQLPIYRMVANPNGVPGAFVIFLEWPTNASNTAARSASGRTTVRYDSAAGLPTVTSVQGSWAQSQFYTPSFINSQCGASINPNGYAYVDFSTNSTIDYGDVSAGVADTVIRLQFLSTAGNVEMVEGVNGTGGDALDNCLTGGGLQATLQFRPNAATIFTTWALNQSSPILPLPVELIYQDAVWSGNDALVTWGTASELNNDRFEIYRSFDGSNFELIGDLSSKAIGGNSNEILEYSFTDVSILPKTDKYVVYRIKQIDFDGTSETFRPLVLRVESATQRSIAIYPVPAKDAVTVRTNALVEGDMYTLNIVDNIGKIVQRATFVANANANNTSLDIRDLPAGVYWVQVDGAQFGFETQKFVKIN